MSNYNLIQNFQNWIIWPFLFLSPPNSKCLQLFRGIPFVITENGSGQHAPGSAYGPDAGSVNGMVPLFSFFFFFEIFCCAVK